jgi:hypothetical protein
LIVPAEARRLIEKLEIVHTPKHESWLNAAEVELAVLDKQSIGGPVPDQNSLSTRTRTWERERNRAKVKINWQFRTADARVKLQRLYPHVQSVRSRRGAMADLPFLFCPFRICPLHRRTAPLPPPRHPRALNYPVFTDKTCRQPSRQPLWARGLEA